MESEFDTYIQKAKKTVMDTRNHSAIKNVASELQDVQKIMGRNHIRLTHIIWTILYGPYDMVISLISDND